MQRAEHRVALNSNSPPDENEYEYTRKKMDKLSLEFRASETIKKNHVYLLIEINSFLFMNNIEYLWIL